MPSGEYSTMGMVSSSAMKNLLRMSRSIAAAMPGSDMAWPAWSWSAMAWPAWSAGAGGAAAWPAWAWWAAAVAGISYCMRSWRVPIVMGWVSTPWARCASRR